VEEYAIEKQLVRLARAMDQRDWEVVGDIFASNVRADFGEGEVQGRAQVVAYIRSFLDNCGVTQHLLGNFLVEIEGDTATSEAYVSDMHLAKNPASELTFRTLGNYSDQWVHEDGTWRITRRFKDNRATLGSFDVFRAE
jgi:hypothetical protein